LKHLNLNLLGNYSDRYVKDKYIKLPKLGVFLKDVKFIMEGLYTQIT